MTVLLTDARAALDVLSRAARPQIAILYAAAVAQCQGDQEPLFGATATLLNAVAALEKAIVVDIPALIGDVEAALSTTARSTPLKSEDDGV